MRKLAQLLPIARRYMHPTVPGGQVFTCFAATTAFLVDQMTMTERERLQEAIYARLGPRYATIFDALGFNAEETSLRDPRFIAARDQWLDAMQAELERNDQ